MTLRQIRGWKAFFLGTKAIKGLCLLASLKIGILPSMQGTSWQKLHLDPNHDNVRFFFENYIFYFENDIEEKT